MNKLGHILREVDWRWRTVQPAWGLVGPCTRVKFVAYVLLLRQRPM